MIMMAGDRFEQRKDGEKMIEEEDVNECGVLLDGLKHRRLPKQLLRNEQVVGESWKKSMAGLAEVH